MPDLWAELSATMRLLRRSAGVSLRQAEARSGTGRGTLSQIETGKARPNRHLVEWYDNALGGDGLLLSIYAEARGVRGPDRTSRPRRGAGPAEPRRYEVVGGSIPFGRIATAGATLRAAWTLRNIGSQPWAGWRLVRIGALGGPRLIRSQPWSAVPDCAVGAEVSVSLDLVLPSVAATYAAYWVLVDGDGHPVRDFDVLLSVVVVAR